MVKLKGSGALGPSGVQGRSPLVAEGLRRLGPRAPDPVTCVVPAESWHVHVVAAGMRLADRIEVAAAAGLTPEPALRLSLEASFEAWTGMVADEPVCLFGCAYATLLDRQVGRPWLLGTTTLLHHQVAFLRRNHDYLERWLTITPVLHGYVHASNPVALRWLRWLGFVIEAPEPYGPFGARFRPFRRERDPSPRV